MLIYACCLRDWFQAQQAMPLFAMKVPLAEQARPAEEATLQVQSPAVAQFHGPPPGYANIIISDGGTS